MRKYRSGTRWCLWRWTQVDSEYIKRLHVIKTPWFALCLHWVLKPDPEPYLHDHPVTFLSVILRGWYMEDRSGVHRARKWFNWVRASERDPHAIRYAAPGTLTLCFMGPKTREWGFHTPRGWVHWQTYHHAQRAGIQL